MVERKTPKVLKIDLAELMERKLPTDSLCEIKCINKSDRENPHERILFIGGFNPDGTRWKIGQQQAIEGIETGKWNFYVSVGGKRVEVIVAKSKYGNKYLKTQADGELPDNLLSLDECPL